MFFAKATEHLRFQDCNVSFEKIDETNLCRSLEALISTVGYGDITMHSDWGRAVTLFTILIALLILPVQINNIMELAS